MYSQQMFNEYNQDTGTWSALCRSWDVVSYLPAAHAEQEAHHIGLLLLLKLLEVFVGTHLFLSSAPALAFGLWGWYRVVRCEEREVGSMFSVSTLDLFVAGRPCCAPLR